MSSVFVLCNLLQKWVCYACPKFWKFLPECTVQRMNRTWFGRIALPWVIVKPLLVFQPHCFTVLTVYTERIRMVKVQALVLSECHLIRTRCCSVRPCAGAKGGYTPNMYFCAFQLPDRISQGLAFLAILFFDNFYNSLGNSSPFSSVSHFWHA